MFSSLAACCWDQLVSRTCLPEQRDLARLALVAAADHSSRLPNVGQALASTCIDGPASGSPCRDSQHPRTRPKKKKGCCRPHDNRRSERSRLAQHGWPPAASPLSICDSMISPWPGVLYSLEREHFGLQQVRFPSNSSMPGRLGRQQPERRRIAAVFLRGRPPAPPVCLTPVPDWPSWLSTCSTPPLSSTLLPSRVESPRWSSASLRRRPPTTQLTGRGSRVRARSIAVKMLVTGRVDERDHPARRFA